MILDVVLKVTHDLAVQVGEAEDGFNQRIDVLIKENGDLQVRILELQEELRSYENFCKFHYDAVTGARKHGDWCLKHEDTAVSAGPRIVSERKGNKD